MFYLNPGVVLRIVFRDIQLYNIMMLINAEPVQVGTGPNLYRFATIRPLATDFCAGASRFAWGRLLWRDVWNVSVADGALSVAFCLLLSPTL
jgi:hypothetical protein